MTDPKYADHEYQIAEIIFEKYGCLLSNGKIDGLSVGLEFIEEYSGGRSQRWRSPHSTKKNGKVQIRIGKDTHWLTGEPSVGYRQKNDGTFNYEKIANRMMEMRHYALRVQNKRNKESDNFKSNRKLISKLNKTHNVFSCGLGTNDRGDLYFKVDRLTEEQGEKLVETALEMGLLSSKEMREV